MDLGIRNKVALVIGASKGIGFGIARELAVEGAKVVIASRIKSNVDEAVEKIKGEFPKAKVKGTPLDMNQEPTIREAIGKILDEHAIDILVNNSGGPPTGSAVEFAIADWDKGYRVVLRSVLLTTKLVLPKMIEQKWGRILTVTSTAAKELIPRLSMSSTFRAGLGAWVKNMAKEVSSQGVLINNILPGPINTARLQELAQKSPAFFNAIQSESALGRLGEIEEIGKVGAFLCSSANVLITGANIVADGGYTRSF